MLGGREEIRSIFDVDLRSSSISLYEKLSSIALEPSRPISIIEQWVSTSTPTATQSDLFDALSEIILHPLCTIEVAIRFYPLLPDILARSLERVDTIDAGWSDSITLQFYHASARLLYSYSSILPIFQQFLSIPSLRSIPQLEEEEIGDLEAFLLSTYRLIDASPNIFTTSQSIQISKASFGVVRSFSTASSGAKLLALRIFASLEGVSEATHEELQIRYVGHPGLSNDKAEAEITISCDSEVVEEVDGWIVPLQELERVQSIRVASESHCTGWSEGVLIDTSQLRKQSACLGGYLFHRPAPLLSLQESYRETERLKPTISNLGQKLAAHLPILLSGPEACGKTSLIRYICSLLRPNDIETTPIITLQLGDQSGIDAKSLIGSFISSTKTPGTFEWAEGALTRAVRFGKWVVLEDVDRASGEVLSVIKPLVEDMCKDKAIGARPSLDLGSRGRIEAGKSFALFATRTTPNVKERQSMPKATYFGHEHWEEVQMRALDEDDILTIVKSNNKLLSSAQDGTPERLVSTWLKLVNTASNKNLQSSSSDRQSSGTIRVPSFHDLLKWCRRIEASIERSGPSASTLARAPLSNQALQEEMALEACDIFLGSTPPSSKFGTPGTAMDSANAKGATSDRYTVLIDLIAAQLGVDRMAVWHSVAEKRPECKVESDGRGEKKIVIGRSQLQRSSSIIESTNVAPISRNFAMTGPAARLMERIAVCVSLCEPTLIVGETGTGKTTVVQHLASLVRKPLIALNLSQQTETSDLLGGFKPLDPKMPAMELHNEWVNLFQQTFSSRRNARFMQAERKALQSEKWSRLYETWRESVRLALNKVATETEQPSDVDVGEGEEDRREVKQQQQQQQQRATKARRLTNKGTKQNQFPSTSTSPPFSKESCILTKKWIDFRDQIESFAVQYTGKKRHLVFAFVEGPLVKAIRSGSWVLLDEINLATSETLDCLTALLQSPDSSIVLTERGDLEPVPRHPDFRLFACMNPATDVGKKDLPNSLRTRFTELYAPSPDSDQEALVSIVEKYIGQEAVGDRSLLLDVAQCYSQIRKLSQNHQLADGANQRPHYSIRTLSRALTFAKDLCAVYGLRRAIWEGFIMTFTMLLEEKSAKSVRELIDREIMFKAKNANSLASFIPPRPTATFMEGTSPASYVQLGSFWVETGAFPLDSAEDYVLTPSVQEKLIGLARAAVTRRSPVLIQGPTSAGKTSAVEYLAKRTGHKFVRINNHEHTDIQEYIGSYSSDADSGRLEFHEGLLVTALRQGHWIVLDELNLAPTDVLEALNRLLDDNRELVIPETGQVVKPHPHFMLFATQNPPGLYAGRKVLSRAFRNRFLEIHFQDVPQAELQTILTNRCRIAPSYAEKVVQVFRELQRRRQTGRVFDTKQAFVTLRDLFRWGNRPADNYQQLAENGYMLIAERARRVEDSVVVKEVIEEVINVKINVGRLYDLLNPDILTERVGSDLAVALLGSIQGTGIVWTASIQRLACLIACALRNSEPVLLVGETGSGKTSVCQVLANVFGRHLVTVNCHQSTDTADLIGGQRPLRNRSAMQEAARQYGIQLVSKHGVILPEDASLDSVVSHLSTLKTGSADAEMKGQVEAAISRINHSTSLFEWNDGPLVQAMKDGNHLLLDEISLADDSVLERLNSVLEPGRTLVLAERSNSSATQSLEIKANSSFQVVATMNPGGDYGKKELSPALRNRFTEIWVPAVSDRSDLLQIINSQWSVGSSEEMQEWAIKMVDFLHFYSDLLGGRDSNAVGLRDLIAWATFINAVMDTTEGSMSVKEAFANGAFMTLIDGVALHSWVATKPKQQIRHIIHTLSARIFSMIRWEDEETNHQQEFMSTQLTHSDDYFHIGKFAYAKGTKALPESSSTPFNLSAKTPSLNTIRVLRAMQIKDRAIMLEGSPGAGKTSLIVALAKECNYKLTRINLSDQTELSDLFGADLPIEGGKPGEFDWRDAAFLQAMQKGTWVLLDEMNLASQTVLEGLNSCLDHRGSVFIPDLGRSFTKHPDFRIFAAQNPQHQGGGRKGLPKSFLNRFTKVYVEELQDEDYSDIITTLYPAFDADILAKMIKFNGQLQLLLQDTTLFSKAGQPWEFNLRALLRWLSMIHSHLGLNLKQVDPIEYLGSLYVLRFRNRQDRVKVTQLFQSIFGVEVRVDHQPWSTFSTKSIQLGHVVLSRKQQKPLNQRQVNVPIAKIHLAVLQSLGECVRLGWPSILVGESQSGKTTLVRHLAQLTNCQLEEVRLNNGTDATDVIGGFQQVDGKGEATVLLHEVMNIVQSVQTSVALLINQGAEEQDAISNAKLFFSQQVDILDGKDNSPSLDWQNIVHSTSRLKNSLYLTKEERAMCTHALHRFQELSHQEASQTTGKFAWIDGPVLRAMRKGCWLLLDDANLCSSSVLDRLNSLLEPGGNLVLSERGVIESGQVEVIEPHPDFRVFFALNSRYGELSRAMRNRGLEIFVESFEQVKKWDDQVVGEASLRNVQIWTEPVIKQPVESHSHKLTMSLALLARALSPLQLGLAKHILPQEQASHLQILTANELIRNRSKMLKAGLEGSSNVDASFLNDMGMDLQLNPFTYQRDGAQNNFSNQSILLVKTSTFITYLKQQTTVNVGVGTQILPPLSILQKSAQGYDDDELSREDRHLYSLVLAMAKGLQQRLGIDAELDARMIPVMELLLDCVGFLTSAWSKATLNDYSITKIIVEKMQVALTDLSRLGMTSIDDVEDEIDAVSRQVKLTSGYAMHQIWRSFLPVLFDPEALNLAISISRHLSLMQGKVTVPELVRNAIEVAATLRQEHSQWAEDDRQELISVARRTLSALQSRQRRSEQREESNRDEGERDQDDVLLLSSFTLAIQYGSEEHNEFDQKRRDSLVELVTSSQMFPKEVAISVKDSASRSLLMCHQSRLC